MSSVTRWGCLIPMSSPTSCTASGSPTTASAISRRIGGVCDRVTTSDPIARQGSRPAISPRCARSTAAERRPVSNCYDDNFMRKMVTRLVVVAAVVPGTAAPAPGGAAPGSPAAPAAVKPMPAQMPAVVARVNGETIERWEFENAVKRVEARAGGPVPPEKRDEVLRDVLDQLVAYHLLAQESRARKMEVSDKDVEARLAQIRQSFPNEDAFKQGLA